MVQPTFETKDAFGGMEIYPGGRGGAMDLSDDAVRKIEDSLNVSDKPKPVVHSKLFEQLDPEERVELKVPSGEFDARTARPTELTLDERPSNVLNFPSKTVSSSVDVVSPPISKSPERNINDIELEQMALQSFYEGKTDLTIRYFSEMQDREVAREQIKTVIGKLEASKDYDNALILSNLLDQAPQGEGRRVNLKIVRDTKPEALKVDNAGEGILEKHGLDESREIPSAVDIAMRATDKYVEKKIEEDKDRIPTAIELAMKKTDKYVETKSNVTPPEVPPTSETLAPLVPNEPRNIEARESVEANLEALRVARDKYATAFTEWEYRKKNSTKLWEKTMFSLGASKPVPERLTLRTTELEDARGEYLKMREICGKKTTNTYVENYQRGTEENLLLQAAMLNAKKAREESDAQDRKLSDEMIPKTTRDRIKDSPASALRFLNNKWLSMSPGRKALLASSLVAGSWVFAAPVAGVAGFRVARSVLGLAVGKTVGTGFGKYFDNKNATNEELDLKEYAGSINEANFAEVEAKRLQAFENSLNTRRRQGAVKIGAMVAAGGATTMASGSYFSSLVGDAPISTTLESTGKLDVVPAVSSVNPVTPEALGAGELNVDLISPDLAQEVHSLKVDILSHYHDTEVPYAIKKNILDVPTEKLLEQFHLLDAEHNASAGSIGGGHILFENGKVVYEQGGITRDLFDPNIEIGQKAYSNLDFGAKQGIELEPEPIPAKDVLTGEQLKPLESVQVSETVSSVDVPKMADPTVIDDSKINTFPDAKGHIQIPVGVGKSLEVIDMGSDKTMMFEGKAISHMEDSANGRIPVLDDKYQDGRENMNLRSAFSEAFNKVVDQKNMGTNKFSPFQEPFEGGKISILYGTPEDPNHLSMVLNGKEIAVGSVKDGVPKFTMHSELKGGLFTDTVYERAFKVMGKKIKAKVFEF